jgi:hypothetical protein
MMEFNKLTKLARKIRTVAATKLGVRPGNAERIEQRITGGTYGPLYYED